MMFALSTPRVIHRPDRGRKGAALAEFALVLFPLYLLVAGILTFGQLLWVGQNLQQVVDVGAQETARMAFRPTVDFDTVRESTVFQQQIYDEQFLVIQPSTLGSQSLSEYADSNLPLINRLLVPMMIYDTDQDVYRYPGALVTNNTTGHQTVLVPLLDYSANPPTITWLLPVDEIKSSPNSATPVSAFPINATDPNNTSFVPGIVALRINYPFQSATMSGFRQNPAGPLEPNANNVIEADDAAMSDGSIPSTYSLSVTADSGNPGPTEGRYGLGKQIAWAKANGVRPFRKVISVQAVYRREVFERSLEHFLGPRG